MLPLLFTFIALSYCITFKHLLEGRVLDFLKYVLLVPSTWSAINEYLTNIWHQPTVLSLGSNFQHIQKNIMKFWKMLCGNSNLLYQQCFPNSLRVRIALLTAMWNLSIQFFLVFFFLKIRNWVLQNLKVLTLETRNNVQQCLIR